MDINYKKSFSIIFISFAIALAYNFISPNGIGLIREEIEVVYSDEEAFEESNMIAPAQIGAISTERVYEVFMERSAKFIDARDQWDFADGHIPGAINIPEYKFTPNEPKLEQLEKSELIIIYCSGEDCDISKRLASEMQKLGYTNIYVYLGGWIEWAEGNFPIEKD